MKSGCLNADFSGTITATTSSNLPIKFELVAGSIPDGLEMTTSGNVITISGIPAIVGSYTFKIKASLPTGENTARNYTINIAEVDQTPLAGASIGVAYSQTVSVDGPSDGSETWLVASGALPNGLTLNASTGEISGTPTVAGNFTFIICFSNSL